MGLLTPLGSAWRIRRWRWRGVSSQSMKSALELQGGDLSGEWPGKFLKFPEAVWSVCEECWLQQLEPLVVQQGPSMGLVALSHVSFILGQLFLCRPPPSQSPQSISLSFQGSFDHTHTLWSGRVWRVQEQVSEQFPPQGATENILLPPVVLFKGRLLET